MRLIQFTSILLVITLSSSVFSATINVDARGRGDYPTIDAAIDASVNGDVIVLADGTYRGDGNRDIFFDGKAITLRSENGPDRCIVDCQGTEDENHRGFYLMTEEGADTIIDGLTIRNGYLSGDGIFGNGAAIYCRSTSPTIQNCIIEDCTAPGGALRLQSSNSIVTNCTFRRNQSNYSPVSVTEEQPQFINCLFTENTSGYRGGALWTSGSDVTFTGCLFVNNTVGEYGGAMYLSGGQPTLTDCCIVNNSSSQHGGGISINNDSEVTLEGCLIDHNRAVWSGAGIYCLSSVVDINSCFIRDNIGESNGGGIFAGQSTITFCNSVINGNTGDFGGGIYVSGNLSTLVVEQCTVASNRAEYYGGAVFVREGTESHLFGSILWNNESIYPGNPGGQIAALDTDTQIQVSYCDVMNGASDEHTEGGAVVTWGDGNIDVDPCFVSEGQWDTNETDDTYDDDVWSPGDYQLMADSECIDTLEGVVIIEGMTDIIGNTRLYGEAIDMGAYENVAFEAMGCTKLTLKAGRARPDEATAAGDSLMVNGTFEGTQADFEAADYCSFRVGSWAQTVACEDFRGRAPRLNYRGGSTGIKSLNLDFGKGTFKASAKGIDLTGTAAPVPIILSFGTYYGEAEAADAGAADVINTRKNVPIQFMSGFEDALRLTRVRCTQDNDEMIKLLSVQGEITLAEAIDLESVEAVFNWGTLPPFTLFAGSLEQVSGGKFQYSEREGRESYKVVIDLNKCTYKIDFKNTGDLFQDSPVDIRLRLGSEFDQTVSGVTF